ncbi:hypothetical protein Nos7524_4958 [Nostoc sp. PCC 7524]|uniref:hypothetical protein n=1 Tax=Nostoc sp. (strain ATCC 29411 / PCC 7524) TaxID=28072 RepID=UPI00029F0162|nr:hypothetical protein [Nostoc sp. PCC 7524]AFY50684.1 hypothetical protein Nos7524_4958 [Nostoc sp. PCC 7524]
MSRTLRRINQYRRKNKNLIAANKIKPEKWCISNTEAQAALNAKGYNVKQIKKIYCLKYQVCISYWDTKGNICSSFFSYRIFIRWQKEVENLIYGCQILKEWQKLNYLLKHEFAYYQYPSEMEAELQTALENRLSVLTNTAPQAV